LRQAKRAAAAAKLRLFRRKLALSKRLARAHLRKHSLFVRERSAKKFRRACTRKYSKKKKVELENSELVEAESSSKSKESDTVQAGWWRRRRRRRRRRWWGSSTERNQKNHARERVNKERSWKHALRERAAKKERGGKFRARQAAAP